MTEQIQQRLREEMPPQPQTTVTPDGLVSAGRRSRRRRLLTGTGCGVAVVAAAVVAVTLIVPGNAADLPSEGRPPAGDPGPTASADDETDGTSLADLDPDLAYIGENHADPSEQELLAEGSAAFLAHMATEYPDALTVYAADEANTPAEVGEPLDELVQLAGVGYTIRDGGETSEPDKGQTVDTFFYESRVGPVDFNAEEGLSTAYGEYLSYALSGDLTASESINLRVYPADAFIQDSGDRFDLAHCHGGNHIAVGCDQETVTGPNGETIVEISGDGTQALGNADVPVHRVVVYRDDGTAVVATSTVGTYMSPQTSLSAPTMSFDDLTGIALSLPQSPLPPVN